MSKFNICDLRKVCMLFDLFQHFWCELLMGEGLRGTLHVLEVSIILHSSSPGNFGSASFNSKEILKLLASG